MITAAYTLLTLVVIAVSGFAAYVRPQAREVLAAALFIEFMNYSMLIGIEVVNLAGYQLKPPSSMILYPVIDAVCVGMCSWTFLRRHTTWKLCLTFGFLAMLVGHVFFWATWEGSRNGGNAQIFAYILWSNVWGFYQLLVLLFAGGGYAADWIIDRAAISHGGHNRNSVRAG